MSSDRSIDSRHPLRNILAVSSKVPCSSSSTFLSISHHSAVSTVGVTRATLGGAIARTHTHTHTHGDITARDFSLVEMCISSLFIYFTFFFYSRPRDRFDWRSTTSLGTRNNKSRVKIRNGKLTTWKLSRPHFSRDSKLIGKSSR